MDRFRRRLARWIEPKPALSPSRMQVSVAPMANEADIFSAMSTEMLRRQMVAKGVRS